MTTVTFACPDCRTNLKTSRRITPDRDVRCPTCGTVFPAPPETDSDLLEFDEESTDLSAQRIALVVGVEQMTSTPGPQIGSNLLRASYLQKKAKSKAGSRGCSVRSPPPISLGRPL